MLLAQSAPPGTHASDRSLQRQPQADIAGNPSGQHGRHAPRAQQPCCAAQTLHSMLVSPQPVAVQAFTLGDFPGIFHLRGGALGWSKSRLPFDGEYNAGGAGRTPNVVSGDAVAEEERDAVDTIRNVQADQ